MFGSASSTGVGDVYLQFVDKSGIDSHPSGSLGAVSEPAAATVRPSDRYTADRAEKRLIAVPLLATGVAGAVVILVAGLSVGVAGLIAGLLGTVIVVAFFGGGQVVISRVLRNNPAVAFNVAMLVYLAQIVVLFGLLLFLKRVTVFSPTAFALTVFVGVIVWTIAAVTMLTRAKVLYVEPASGHDSGHDSGRDGSL